MVCWDVAIKRKNTSETNLKTTHGTIFIASYKTYYNYLSMLTPLMRLTKNNTQSNGTVWAESAQYWKEAIPSPSKMKQQNIEWTKLSHWFLQTTSCNCISIKELFLFTKAWLIILRNDKSGGFSQSIKSIITDDLLSYCWLSFLRFGQEVQEVVTRAREHLHDLNLLQ